MKKKVFSAVLALLLGGQLLFGALPLMAQAADGEGTAGVVAEAQEPETADEVLPGGDTSGDTDTQDLEIPSDGGTQDDADLPNNTLPAVADMPDEAEEYGLLAEGSLVLEGGWRVDNRNSNLVINDDGSVTITTERGEFDNEYKNLVSREIPYAASFELTVKVEGRVSSNYQGAFLMIFSGGHFNDCVEVTRRYHTSQQPTSDYNKFGMLRKNGGETYVADKRWSEDEVYLKLVKQDSYFTGYYRFPDDGDWTEIASFQEQNLMGVETLRIGFTANAGGQNNGTPITFSEFKMNDVEIPLTQDESELYTVELTADAGKIDIGGTAKLSTKGFNAKGDEYTSFGKLVFTSSDTDIATVDTDGVVTGVGVGTVTLRVDATLGSVTCTATTSLQVGDIGIEDTWQVTSPDGKTVLVVDRLNTGALQYSALQDNKLVMGVAPIGLVTNLGDLTRNLELVAAGGQIAVYETYEMISGKKDVYTNSANERTLTFRLKGTEVLFDLVVRAYDDGVAYRYGIRFEDGRAEELLIRSETSAFQLPADALVYYMNHGGGKWSYEAFYQNAKAEELVVGSTPSIPLLYQTTDGVWALITEAALNGEYWGSMVTVEDGGLLRLTASPLQSGPAVSETGWLSPWRTAIIGDEQALIDNTMVENLAPARMEGYDFDDWVTPGNSAWSWFPTGPGGQQNMQNHMDYIDMAAAMGWDYYILDEAWQPRNTAGGNPRYRGYHDGFDEVLAHAKEKGIGLIAWVHWDDIKDENDRRERLTQWAADGIVGLKADFFESESQEILKLYDDLYRECAELGLILNIHGGNKPTGELRTWPNTLAREAVYGQEQHNMSVQQYTLIPFIRAAIGTTDVTETVYPSGSNAVSSGFQLALSPLIENGIRCLGSSINDYQTSVHGVFYQSFPNRWDESVYLGGEVGGSIAMARRAGNEWIVGGISVEATTMQVPLSFLADGEHYALVWRESSPDSRRNLTMEYMVVTNTTVLEIPVQAGGGYAMRIDFATATAISAAETDIELSIGGAPVQLAVDATPQNVISALQWSSSNNDVVTVDQSGSLTAVAAGKAVVTVASAYDTGIKLDFAVTVLPEAIVPNDTVWTVVNDDGSYYYNADNSVTILAQRGDDPDKNQFYMDVPAGEDFEITAKITGGLNGNHQAGLLMVTTDYYQNKQYVGGGRRFHSGHFSQGENERFAMMSIGGTSQEFYLSDYRHEEDVYIKLTKVGNRFTTYYRYDEGDPWTQVISDMERAGEYIDHTTLGSAGNIQVGFMASSGGGGNNTYVTFSEFTYNEQPAPIGESRDDVLLYFDITPADATVVLTETGSGTEVVQSTSNAYVVQDGKVYNYTVTREGFLTKTGSVTVSGNTDVPVTLDADPTYNVDKSALAAIINEAGKLAAGDYTATSWAALQAALGKALATLASSNVTAADVDAAVTALRTAIDALVKVPDPVDKTVLSAIIGEADKLVASDYTTASWLAFQAVLAGARATYNSGSATAANVNTAVTTLRAAINGLEKVPGPVTYPVTETSPAYTGEGSVRFVIDADASKFQSATLDGRTLVRGADYTVEAGSTIITLQPALLQTLQNGSYTLQFTFADGTATATLTIQLQDNTGGGTGTGGSGGSVATGDGASMVLYIVLSLAALVALAAIVSLRVKKRRKES